jgi:hypothetical protein
MALPVAVAVAECDDVAVVRVRLVLLEELAAAVVLEDGGEVEVDVLATVGMGVAAPCAWKPSTAAVPNTVAETTMGARLISAPPQKANDSKWMCLAGTRACVSAPATDSVNGSGPQT